jgi:polyvinyl alcohol dehydrogenase (cytochrome)
MFTVARFRLRTTLLLTCGLSAAVAFTALPLGADDARGSGGWPMIGRDVANSRTQPDEDLIGPAHARRLAPKWVLTVDGDVSATPAVSSPRGEGRGRRPGRSAVYFTDWGGMLWKVDAKSGEVVWSRAVSEYNGIADSISRSSPVLSHGNVYVADLNGNLMAVDAATGALRWITRLDPHPAVIVTTSPIVLGDRLYISTSSRESAYARETPGYVCCTFRGSMLAVDARTGAIVWQSFVLPDNGGQAGGFAGGAFVNPPVIDLENRLVYGGAGQTYTRPASVDACLAAAPGGWSEDCFPPDAYFNSLVAFDLRTGEPRWGFRMAGPEARELACGDLPSHVTWCPEADNFSIWDLAGSGANVFTARIRGEHRRVVGIGQKSGVYWAIDAATGNYLWSTLVGPGSDPGGIQWGTAYDGSRIYAAIGHNTGEAYRLKSGQVVTGGSWAALDPSSGRILWQTADPQGAPDLASLTVANGVVYGGSMAHTGDQMYALHAASGRILWSFAAGGSVVAGPAVSRGMVFWGSGYARTGGVGNDKFYAFSVKGR